MITIINISPNNILFIFNLCTAASAMSPKEQMTEDFSELQHDKCINV